MSTPQHWLYVDTGNNPADLATRGVNARNLGDCQWLPGPSFLNEIPLPGLPNCGEIVTDEDDPEVRRQTNFYATEAQLEAAKGLGSTKIYRLSTWSSLLRAIANLIVRAKEFKIKRPAGQPTANAPQAPSPVAKHSSSTRTVSLPRLPSVEEFNQACTVLIKAAQEEAFPGEIRILSDVNNDQPDNRQQPEDRKKLMKSSPLYRLDPFIEDEGVLRVGGRLRRSNFNFNEKHPVLLPKGHYL